MSWAEIKKALNTSLGTEHEVALNERPYSVKPDLIYDNTLTKINNVFESTSAMTFDSIGGVTGMLLWNNRGATSGYNYDEARLFSDNVWQVLLSSSDTNGITFCTQSHFDNRFCFVDATKKNVYFNRFDLLTTTNNLIKYIYVYKDIVVYIKSATNTRLMKRMLDTNTEKDITSFYVSEQVIFDIGDFIYCTDKGKTKFYKINVYTEEITELSLTHTYPSLTSITKVYKDEKQKMAYFAYNDVNTISLMFNATTDEIMPFEPNLTIDFPLQSNIAHTSNAKTFQIYDNNAIEIERFAKNDGSSLKFVANSGMQNLYSLGDSKSNMYLIKGSKVISSFKLYHVVDNVPILCENIEKDNLFHNTIEVDGVYSTRLPDSMITVI